MAQTLASAPVHNIYITLLSSIIVVG